MDSDLVEAVSKLEQKPDSNARQAVLQEEVETSQAAKDADVIQAAETLIEKLKDLPDVQVEILQEINVKGNRNIITGQGDVTVNE